MTLDLLEIIGHGLFLGIMVYLFMAIMGITGTRPVKMERFFAWLVYGEGDWEWVKGVKNSE